MSLPSYDDAARRAHALEADELLSLLGASPHGLSPELAAERLRLQGPNVLPRARPPSLARLFLHQFASPLIYLLLAAAVISLLIGEWSDAAFIAGVLLINAVVGTIQEYSAQRAAEALRNLVTPRCRVLRGGDTYEIASEELVAGDIVLLESGDRVPADIRLLDAYELSVDESLLSGESRAAAKGAGPPLALECVPADRGNMLFAGTLVEHGRGRGVVSATGASTELGAIATAVLGGPPAPSPLLLRMHAFSRRIALLVAVAVALMMVVALARGMSLEAIFFSAVALAVSVIPEGLIVALTVALAIGMRRMARRHVIVRRLLAVEALGSCTYIATDKTGTLTLNQLSVRKLFFPGVEGEFDEDLLVPLCRTAILANEGFIGHRDGDWVHQGDAVDVALLLLARESGLVKAEQEQTYPELAAIPFESERQFSASLNVDGDGTMAHVKGALERLLPMCERMVSAQGLVPLDAERLEAEAERMASRGFRVLALASGSITLEEGEVFSEEHLGGLTLLGLVGMIDPLRPEAKQALAACRSAGVELAMITGDHPLTALAIARELGMAEDESQIVTGRQLREAQGDEAERLIAGARVFARVEPRQKVEVVQALQRRGHFVAVSGDGANDAPAMRAAQVGIAMGRGGTDVARETADLIITDDNIASIVAGVEEGRVAYANVRKVTFLLISTGAAELVLFILALISGLPLPLLAVQLLWLNLVTNGIQDVALAFEPAEGDELKRPPRSPHEPIFDRLMLERVLVSALVIGAFAFVLFRAMLAAGFDVEEARNATLLLMVLFENVQVFNSRSESRSLLRHSPLRNPLLLFGTVAAQLIHIGALYTPGIREVLHLQPVSFELWWQLLGIALSVLLAMELHKWWWGWRERR